MSTLSDLIAELEVAEEGSRELDRDIWLEIEASPSSIKDIGCYVDPAAGCVDGAIHAAPNYTTNLDAALSLVPEGWSTGMDMYADGRAVARCWGKSPATAPFGRGPDTHHCEGHTPALALCVAALRAVEAGREGE